jgi:hypothetical protein
MHLTLKGNETGLVSYWQFNEVTGTSAADKINGNNGALHNFSTSGWVESTIPAGGGISFTNEVSTPGPVTFTGTGIDMNFMEKTGSDSIVVSRIDSSANLNPVEIQEVFHSQYWVVHKYGSGTMNANLAFTFSENLTAQDELNPSNIKLYTRGSTTDTSWACLASAVSVNGATNQATFEGLTGFSQFIAGRAVQVPSNLIVANTSIHNNETECYDATNVITVSDFLVEIGGSATFIASESIHFMPDLSVQPGGYLHGNITTTGNYCTSQSQAIAAVVVGGNEILSGAGESWFKFYPNPVTGNLTLEFQGDEIPAEVRVEIYGMHGETILQTVMHHEKRRIFCIESVPSGIYLLRLRKGNESVTRKIVKI